MVSFETFSEGMCNCVNTESGEEILGTMVRFSKPVSCKLTRKFDSSSLKIFLQSRKTSTKYSIN